MLTALKLALFFTLLAFFGVGCATLRDSCHRVCDQIPTEPAPEPEIFEMMALGAGGGAVIGGAIDFLGGILGSGAAKRRAKAAWNRTKNAYKHRYQWQMKDMRRAGLNPILSATTGAPTAGGAPMADSSAIPDAAHAVSGKAMQYATLKLTQAQTRKTNAEAKSKENELEWQPKRLQEELSILMDKGDIIAWDRHQRHAAAIDAMNAAQLVDEEKEALIAATHAAANASNANARERLARAALEEAGFPLAKFEGMGGMKVIELLETLLLRKVPQSTTFPRKP